MNVERYFAIEAAYPRGVVVNRIAMQFRVFNPTRILALVVHQFQHLLAVEFVWPTVAGKLANLCLNQGLLSAA